MLVPATRCARRAPRASLVLAAMVVLILIACGSQGEAGGVKATPLSADPPVIVVDRAARGRERLYAVRPDGSVPRPLKKAFATSRMLSLEWSHDRSKLAFRSLGRGSPLWVMNANGTGRKLLARDAADFTWSPDDRRLVFVEDDRSEPWLTVINVDGGGRRSLTPGVWPEWSADGRIYFVRGGVPGWPKGTFSINPDAGAERRFPIDFEQEFVPSPDGKQIAFEDGYGRGDRFYGGLHVVGADGTGLKQLSPLSTQGIAWSPGGDRIAFVTNSSFFELGVVNVDGTGLRNLAQLRCCGSLFSWSPDGTRIAFDAAYTDPEGGLPGKSDIFVVSTGGGRPTRVTRRLRPRGDNTDPSWVPASHLR
jgi:Tol biopolymer transport system component